jgi:4-hydroxy 2-oxovalerate aldolase
MNDHIWDVRITDTSLRDGSHHKRHQFTKEEVHAIVAALDAAGVPVIEVTHGDGLGGSSFNYGFSKVPEQELIKLAAETVTDSRIAFLMLPGVGTKDDIREAQNNGGSICRIATHCTEADDEPYAAAGEAGRAGAHHGRRRLSVRVRGRLRRCAGPRPGGGPGVGSGG